MDFLDILPGDIRTLYASAGSGIAESSGLRSYMKERGIGDTHRNMIYTLIGASMDDSCSHARDCVFSLMKEAEHVIEQAPEMRGRLREILRPRWEEYHATLMEGIDASVKGRLNETLVGPDPQNPIVPDAERHSIYRVIGEIRRGIRPKDDISEIFDIFSRHNIGVGVVMEMTHLLKPADQEENEPEAVRGDRD
jgi:hypothetical protein